MGTITILKLELLKDKRNDLLKELIDLEVKSRLGDSTSMDKEQYEKIKKSITIVEDMINGTPKPINK